MRWIFEWHPLQITISPRSTSPSRIQVLRLQAGHGISTQCLSRFGISTLMEKVIIDVESWAKTPEDPFTKVGSLQKTLGHRLNEFAGEMVTGTARLSRLTGIRGGRTQAREDARDSWRIINGARIFANDLHSTRDLKAP